MKTFTKTIAAVAIVGASIASAQAYWGGPFNWGNGGAPWTGFTDMFGDVDANFSSRGWGRGHGYGYPYYGYGYGPYGYGGPWGGYPGAYGGGYPGYYGAPYAAPDAVAPAAPAAEAK